MNLRPPGYEPDELPTALLRDIYFTGLVPVTGLEPVRYCYREILSLLCLPFHHTGGDWHGLEYHTQPDMSTLFRKKCSTECASNRGGCADRSTPVWKKSVFIHIAQTCHRGDGQGETDGTGRCMRTGLLQNGAHDGALQLRNRKDFQTKRHPPDCSGGCLHFIE